MCVHLHVSQLHVRFRAEEMAAPALGLSLGRKRQTGRPK